YGVEATTASPRVPDRETVHGHGRAEGRDVKQSGGRGQYGICVIEVEPTARGEGFVWEDKIFGGSIPQNFRPSVQKGIVDTMSKGVVAGYPMVDVKVRLVDGKYHTVDSNDMAFQIAGSVAIRRAALDAGPVLLEPIVDATIHVPEKNLGDIMSDINGRRGKILGTEPMDGYQNVKAMLPESEVLLLEKGDWGAGTSGASSWMIHGGLRYLEFDWDTTRLSNLDSGHIVTIARNFVTRIVFIVPVLPGDKNNIEEVETALEVYDRY